MARSYAQVQQRIWADPEWRALDGDAQLLYLLLLSQPSLNLAGVLPLQTRRWASCVADWDAAGVDMALSRLADARFVVIDEDTEEVLIRSFIRNDGGFKAPGVLKSALKFAEASQSPAIRAALFVELGRLPRLEGKTAAEGEASIKATRVALDPIGGPTPDPIGDTTRDGTQQEPTPDPIGGPSVSVSVSKSPSVENTDEISRGGSHVSSGPGPDAPPSYPDHCPDHADDPVPPRCGGCQKQKQLNAGRHLAAVPSPMQRCLVHDESYVSVCRGCRSEEIAADGVTA